MRYKFTITGKIRDFVEWQLIHYRENEKQLEQYKADLIPSPTPSYSLTGGGGGNSESRPSEQLVLKMVTDRYIVETTRIVEAIKLVLSRSSEDDIQLIDLVYWKQTYTVEGAGMILNMSKSTAYRRVNNILTAIAVELGYVQFLV